MTAGRGGQGGGQGIDGAWTKVATNLGAFHVATHGGAIVQTALPGLPTDEFLHQLEERFPNVAFNEDARDRILQAAARQFAEYAKGQRKSFDLPLRLEGTAFQTRVWSALSEIPFGETRSYQDVARAIGRPGASRAVGQANHMNPLAPIVPCHRVVTSSGALGGYGGGMPLKRTLLEHEGVHLE